MELKRVAPFPRSGRVGPLGDEGGGDEIPEERVLFPGVACGLKMDGVGAGGSVEFLFTGRVFDPFLES